jgi:predicted negative regulator of RcsB-dependent stress response
VAHISRKELKQDKFRESLEHGAEAVLSHRQFATAAIALAVLMALGAFGWKMYVDRRAAKASATLDEAMKAYNAPVRTSGQPVDPGELSFADDSARLGNALQRFQEAAAMYPRTNAGRLADYYAALCLMDMGQLNQALENLRRLENGGNEELAGLARFQIAQIYDRTGKQDQAIKLLRGMADHPTLLVPKPMVLLELAAELRRKNVQEAVAIYIQLKKDYPGSAISDQAQRALDELPPQT